MGRKKKEKVSSEEQEEDEFYSSGQQFEGRPSNNQTSSKRNKKIIKDPKDKKTRKMKQNKDRKENGPKLGRPPRDQQTIDVYPDPTSNIQESILNYLDLIGLKHGLVFRNQDRKKLNLQQYNPLKIQWTEDHQWDRQKEIKKLQNSGNTMEAIRKYVSQLSSQRPLTEQEMLETFLNIGAIAAQQCTEEIYIILAEALIVIISNTPETEILNNAEQLFNKLWFFSGRFTNLHIKYWIELKNNSLEERISKFKILFNQLCQKVRECLSDGKQQQLRKYLEQEQQSNRELEKIIKNYEKKQQ